MSDPEIKYYEESVNLKMAVNLYSRMQTYSDYKNILNGDDKLEDVTTNIKYTPQEYHNMVKKYLEEMINSNGKIAVTYRKGRTDTEQNGRDYVDRYGIQPLKKSIRGALCKDIYTDYDMSNCHPTILLYMAKNAGVLQCDYSHLEAYINDREHTLNICGLDKELFLKNLNKDEPRGNGNKWLLDFNRQLKNIKNVILEKSDVTTSNTKNPISSRVNKIMCAFENHILNDVITKFNVDKPVKMFDGFMTSDVIAVEDLNKHTEDYGIVWKIKEHDDTIKYEECEIKLTKKQKQSIVKTEQDEKDAKKKIRDDEKAEKEEQSRLKKQHNQQKVETAMEEFKDNVGYDEMKDDFEKDNLMILSPLTYIKVFKEKGLVARYNKKAFGEIYAFLQLMEMNEKGKVVKTPFVNAWCADRKRREYDRLNFYPYSKNESKCPNGEYNTFIPFERASATEFDDEKAIEFVKDYLTPLIMGLTSQCELSTTHLLKMIAHAIQYPEILQLVVVVLKGFEGTGKDTLTDFIKRLIGAKYVFKTDKEKQILGDFNASIENKLIITCDEQDGTNAAQLTNEIKNLSTAPTISINKKGVDAYEVNNYALCFINSNSIAPVQVSETNRRFMINTCDASLLGPEKSVSFFQPMYDMMDNNDAMMNSLFKYFYEMDIKGFVPKNFPVSETAKVLRDNNIHIIKKYLYHELSDIGKTSSSYIKKKNSDEEIIYITGKDMLFEIRKYTEDLGLNETFINDKNMRVQLGHLPHIKLNVRKSFDGVQGRYMTIEYKKLYKHLKEVTFKFEDKIDLEDCESTPVNNLLS